MISSAVRLFLRFVRIYCRPYLISSAVRCVLRFVRIYCRPSCTSSAFCRLGVSSACVAVHAIFPPLFGVCVCFVRICCRPYGMSSVFRCCLRFVLSECLPCCISSAIRRFASSAFLCVGYVFVMHFVVVCSSAFLPSTFHVVRISHLCAFRPHPRPCCISFICLQCLHFVRIQFRPCCMSFACRCFVCWF